MIETNMNIQDVTNSPKDWEDFWYSPEKYGSWEYYNSESEGRDIIKESVSDDVKMYVDYVMGDKPYPPAFKRDSRLSE
jgi:hypothetical protein|tara:strand:+ start:115 stop:348 length:234 start_codon:yes stop_codon:yes gene_type:complete